jgi:transposase
MDDIGIIGKSKGIMRHDGWPSYYSYEGKVHALCNSHHLRELSGAEEEGWKWAGAMITLLLSTNEEVDESGGKLSEEGQEKVKKKYRRILQGEEEECPLLPAGKERKRGRIPKTKNLLERLKKYEDDVLRFMTDKDVPFTNNQAERDIRMAKLQQKISGCFRSWEGTYLFSRIRGYLSTNEKHNVTSAEALNLLFNDKFPDFMTENV